MHTLSPPLPATDDLETQRLILRDGSVAIVRPAGPSDRRAMRRFFHELSPESRRHRFFTERDADELLREGRGFPLLQGFRGRPAADVEALRDVVLRISRLAEAVPEITELDLNPVMVLASGKGCRIVDARIKVAGPGRPPQHQANWRNV